MACHSVFNPIMPCVQKVSIAISLGSQIRVKGSVPSNAHRFWIDLQCGDSACRQEDIALHLNPRFDQMAVIRNTLIDEKWGQEERAGCMPLCRSAVFDLLMECDAQFWKVAFNGQHFCEFRHRIQYNRITHLVVYGDVNITEWKVERPSMVCPPIYPSLPCVQKTCVSLSCGSKIRVKGCVPCNAHRFIIDFECGQSQPTSNVAFHLSHRFDEMVVVRNALIEGNWGTEESSGCMPLRRGEAFDLLIECYEHVWKVAFNCQYFCEFRHRMPFHCITRMAVYGDVVIKQVCN